MESTVLHQGTGFTIHAARGTPFGAIVALKQPTGDLVTERQEAALDNEFEILHGLSLPGIRRVYGRGVVDGKPALYLELFDGLTLRRFVAEHRPALRERVEIAVAIARALAGLHRAGIIHRDLSGANVLVAPETRQICIIDLGLSVRGAALEGVLAEPAGTLEYMAPEQSGRTRHRLDHRADLYALGILLYELFVGELPFVSDDPLDLLHRHLAERPPPPAQRDPSLPAPISELVMALLEKDPDARYQSAEGVVHDLRRCLEQLEARSSIAPFPLRRADPALALSAPPRLYGRDEALSALRATFEQSAASAEVVLIAGHSGIGKTSLVEQLREEVTAAGGALVTGKCEQYARTAPYGVFVQAMAAISARALGLPALEYARTQEAARAAVGDLGQVLLGVMPGLAPLLGEPPSAPVLSGQEAQNRFNHLFSRLLGALLSPERPLVLFLDDLQWIDSASLGLLRHVLGEDRPPGLMLLGAYRDNEVDPSHPLRVALDDLERRGVPIRTLALHDLDPAHVRALLADTFAPWAPGADVEQLAAELHRRTQGNPFHVRCALRDLMSARCLRFSSSGGGWTWEAAALDRLAVTESVIELLARKLAELPARSREVLAVAACVGERAPLGLLGAALSCSAAEIDEALCVAEGEGLLRAGAGEVRFAHDRIQQAAYGLLDEEEQRRWHLRLGRLLLAGPRGDRGEPARFDAADHLGRALDLIDDPEERLLVARLELAAGQRALHAGAPEQARVFLSSGAALLPADAWTALPELASALHRALMEAEFLTARFERGDEIFALLLAREPSPVALADAYYLHIMQRTMQGRYVEALVAGRTILGALGFELPESVTAAELERDLGRLEERLRGRDLRALLDAPAVEDERIRKAAKICGAMCPTGFFVDPLYNGLLGLLAWNIVLDAGPCRGLGFPIATTTLMYYLLRNDYRAGEASARFGMDLAARLSDGLDQGNCAHIYALFTSHWSRPLSDSLPVARQAFTSLIESGDVQMAGYTFFSTLGATYESGARLADVQAEADRALSFVRKTNNRHASGAFVVFARLVAALGAPEGCAASFDGGGFSERAYLAEIGQNQMALAYYHIYKLVLCYLLDAQEDACRHAERATELAPFITGFLPVVTANTYASLAFLRRAEAADAAERQVWLERVASNQRQLGAWAASAAESFGHRHDLVEAERLRLAGEHWAALDLYDRCIERAGASGQIHEGALACELAGRHLLALDKPRLAQPYLVEALHGYRRWGARAKVQQLQATHAALLRRRSTSVAPTSSAPGPATAGNATTESLSPRLDVGSILKAARAVASEIVLDRLLDRLMRVLLENTGSERGLLLLPRGGELAVAASLRVGEGEPALGYSGAVVSYVERAREPLVVDDAATDPRFAGTFGATSGPRSLLCAPLLDRGELVGIVYLENNLTTGAFTPDRLHVTSLLGAQAALSINNALLYATLERKVEERTAELRERNEELERSRLLLAQLADELSTPLIKLGDRVLMAPLIGGVDDARAESIMDRVLSAISAGSAAHVILDVTGVSRMDTSTASHLVRLVRAASLLGAEAILAGVPPQVAMSLASLGVDLSGVCTVRDVQAALARCYRPGLRSVGARG
ncbi:AAA family ATPase [Sorangium sp. So ce375]|uniref:AAA family ATPase n=1 Tax=Sorangium sp. So ce375 TaxID=3133306 RepID=UPI003F5C8D0D